MRESKRTQNIYILIQVQHLRFGLNMLQKINLCLKYDYYDPALSFALIQMY